MWFEAPAWSSLPHLGWGPPRLVAERGRRGGDRLLSVCRAGDQRAGGDRAADQPGGKKGTTILIDRGHGFQLFLVMQVSRIHGRFLRFLCNLSSVPLRADCVKSLINVTL
jgi:hypothetical protein